MNHLYSYRQCFLPKVISIAVVPPPIQLYAVVKSNTFENINTIPLSFSKQFLKTDFLVYIIVTQDLLLKF